MLNDKAELILVNNLSICNYYTSPQLYNIISTGKEI